MDEDHPRERGNTTDHVGGLRTDDDGTPIGSRLHAASFGFARSAFQGGAWDDDPSTPETDTRQPGAGREELTGKAVGKRSADAEDGGGLLDGQERSVAGRRQD